MDEISDRLETRGRALGVPEAVLRQALAGEDPFAVMDWLAPRRMELAGDEKSAEAEAVTGCVETLLRRKILAHPGAGGKPVAPVVFGTGGHRGEIGRGLTLLHVHVIVTALMSVIAGMDGGQRGGHFGAGRPDAGSLEAVKESGFVLGHDNRLFNPDFALYAAHLLREGGYRVRYAGRVSSPELSLLVPLRGWAGSLNFTPSHNPFRYGGVKFAPADGGLAAGDLTDPLAAEANRLLERIGPEEWLPPEALEKAIAGEAAAIERVDVHDVYLDALNEHPVIRLAGLAEELRALSPEKRLVFVADPVWGAAVPVYRRLKERLGEPVMRLLHTEDDPYFGGQTTEPNEQTLSDALAVAREARAPFQVAIRNDPDGDRGLVGDGGGALKMNRFAAVVMRYLMELGQAGQLVTTHATSHQGPDFARAHGSEVVLTPTGFKNFRPYLKDGQALLAYEESDGMTIRGHTLDKDGVLAGLMALRIVLHYGRSLNELAAELESGAGRYHYLQETFPIEVSAAEAHRKLKKLAEITPGQTFPAGGAERAIVEVNGEDGYKFTLDGGAWVMMRPSGTEPKVRVYAESRESPAATRALCEAARKLALEVMA